MMQVCASYKTGPENSQIHRVNIFESAVKGKGWKIASRYRHPSDFCKYRAIRRHDRQKVHKIYLPASQYTHLTNYDCIVKRWYYMI